MRCAANRTEEKTRMMKIEAIIKPLGLADVSKAFVGIGIKAMHIPYRISVDWLLAESWLRFLSGTAGIIWGICSFSG
jgi:hypothetical protein